MVQVPASNAEEKESYTRKWKGTAMKHLLALTFAASAMAWGQNAPKLNARELFYSLPPAPPANPANPPAGSQTATNSGKNTASNSGSNSGSAANKKQTTAKNTTTGSRPATSNASSGGNATGNAQAGNPPADNSGTIVAQVGGAQVGGTQAGQPSVDGGHVIAASITNAPLGLRYAVLKRDPNGAYREVDPDTSFRTGDAIRLQVETNTPGYLYVVTQGTSGQWQLLFPRPEVAGGSNRVEPHAKIEVPGEKGVWKFDEHAGTEKLFLVLARQPEPDLDKLIYAIGGAGGGNGARETLLAQNSIRDDVVSHLREQMNSRDLVFEKVDEGTTDAAPVKGENAAYVVNISTAPDARVVKDFALQHR
jgi:hypothetical protein